MAHFFILYKHTQPGWVLRRSRPGAPCWQEIAYLCCSSGKWWRRRRGRKWGNCVLCGRFFRIVGQIVTTDADITNAWSHAAQETLLHNDTWYSDESSQKWLSLGLDWLGGIARRARSCLRWCLSACNHIQHIRNSLLRTTWFLSSWGDTRLLRNWWEKVC